MSAARNKAGGELRNCELFGVIMRVLLLEHPREASEAHFNDIANTPLWSCLMTGYAGAGLLRAGFEADIVDAARWTSAQTLEYLVDNPSPDLLAVHAVYCWEKTGALFRMLSDLRSHRFDAPICLYGFFPGLVWKEILDYSPAVDYVVVGEPEETMVDLARCIEAGIEARVEGLARRCHGKASLPLRRPPIESPDRLPFPLRPSLESERTVSVLASRGCYNHCSFCLVPALDQGKTVWRGRSPENIAAEISGLVSLGEKDFYFVDPNFVGPGKAGKQAAVKLARRLADFGITFGIETRANDITSGLMRELVEAGLTRLLLGIESGRPDVLKRLGKHTSVAGNEQAIATVREAGLEPEIGFIMFDAASTLDDIVRNLKFLRRNRLLDRLGRTANLLYHDHVAFKGTPGYRTALQRKMLLPRGLFGFEGLLLYEDFRVGWLAGLMKKICHFLLREMENPSSPVHWVDESVRNEPYRAVNDRLVDIFERLLGLAKKLDGPPDANSTERLLFGLMDELRITFAGSPKQLSVVGRRWPEKTLKRSSVVSRQRPEEIPATGHRPLTTLKGSFPFRLATTSYILPAEILPNIRYLGQYFDEIELVLFESGHESNLPARGDIREMARLASDLDITYNVHLPADLFFGDPDRALRLKFCETALSFYDRTLPLAPTCYILHLDSRKADQTVEPDGSAWGNRVRESLRTLQMKGVDLRRVAVENLEYPLQRISPFVEAFDMSFCLDIGHLLRYGHDVAEQTASFLKMSKAVHLHGVDNGKDHTGLDRIARAEWGIICKALEEYDGGLSLEVFSLDDLTVSLDKMREMLRKEQRQ